MLGISKITGGRFGNRILHYNNLMQLSLTHDVPAYCALWEGHQWFEQLVGTSCVDTRPASLITWREVIEGRHIEMITQGLHCAVDGGLIHNFYYDVSKVHPRTFLKIKAEFLPQFDPRSMNLGVHVRGGDILGADGNNGREIHTFEYYRDSMEMLKSIENFGSVNICTDDTGFPLFKSVVTHATNLFGQEKVFLGPSTSSSRVSHIYDFGVLAQCDYLIASSSTYAVCAGFLGKEKKIIHSREWIDKNLPDKKRVQWGRYTPDYPQAYWDQYDKFWQRVYSAESSLYKAWAFV